MEQDGSSGGGSGKRSGSHDHGAHAAAMTHDVPLPCQPNSHANLLGTFQNDSRCCHPTQPCHRCHPSAAHVHTQRILHELGQPRDELRKRTFVILVPPLAQALHQALQRRHVGLRLQGGGGGGSEVRGTVPGAWRPLQLICVTICAGSRAPGAAESPSAAVGRAVGVQGGPSVHPCSPTAPA